MAQSLLERGRESFRNSSWRTAHDQLSAADADRPLDGDDLEHAGLAAYLIGLDDRGDELLSRAYQRGLDQDDGERAALVACWIGLQLADRGAVARAATTT